MTAGTPSGKRSSSGYVFLVDEIDRQLLIYLQREIPFQTRPFEAIGRKIGLDSADVILRIHRLRDEKVIRQISAVFDSGKIAYQSTWIAVKVAEESADAAAAVICRHPGVFACSKWGAEFNLWFVLALPKQEALEGHCRYLEQLTGAQRLLALEAVKIYKPLEGRVSDSKDLSDDEIRLIRILQEDFPLTDEPFRRLAKQADLTEAFLFHQMRLFQKRGFLKRIAAVASRREKSAGNRLVMWRIPEEKIDAAGAEIASFPEVQTCMERSAHAELPYTLYAVAEGVLEAFLRKAEQKIGRWPSQGFSKIKDYKKSRPKYFDEEIEKWRHHFKVKGYEFA